MKKFQGGGNNDRSIKVLNLLGGPWETRVFETAKQGEIVVIEEANGKLAVGHDGSYIHIVCSEPTQKDGIWGFKALSINHLVALEEKIRKRKA